MRSDSKVATCWKISSTLASTIINLALLLTSYNSFHKSQEGPFMSTVFFIEITTYSSLQNSETKKEKTKKQTNKEKRKWKVAGHSNLG
jgi:hypothetical protein